MKINSNYFIILELKKTIENSYVSINPTSNTKNKRFSTTITESPKNQTSQYSKLTVENLKKKVFKTKLFRQTEFSNCDVCGERLKIGTLTLFSAYYNIKGHYDHVFDFINNSFKGFPIKNT